MSMRNRKGWLARSIFASASLGASAAAAIVLGASLPLGIAAGAVAGTSGFFLAGVLWRRRRLPDPKEEIDAVLRDVDARIEELAWLQIRLPAASGGKSTLLKTCDAARAVARRLHQGTATLGPARRADRKLRTCVRIARGYQDLLCGGLLPGTEERRTELIRSIEQEALPKIADQLLNFARDLDEADILDLEVELKVLDRMG